MKINKINNVKLGKRPVRYDERNIQLRAVLKVIPPVPDVFDVDLNLCNSYISNPMYANDVWGDCVIASRSHMTRRFECFEQQGKIIDITDDEVLNEYWAEQGSTNGCKCPSFLNIFRKIMKSKPDRGLVMLDSLNCWRHDGWTAAGQHYDIHAYAQVTPTDNSEVTAAIYLLSGIYVGIGLPDSARNQEIWDVTTGPGSIKYSWGGHCVYISAYSKPDNILTCITWGDRKKMTRAFFEKYCDEAYGIVDNTDRFLTDSPLDVEKLENYLKEITG